MKAVIVCTSVSHGNTRRVAEAMGEVLDAEVVTPARFEDAGYDLIGFGSGIYFGSFSAELREFVRSLPEGQARRAFVFATSGFPEGVQRYPRKLVGPLEQKGFEVVGTFTCRGLDTWGPLKVVGGIRKGRPNAADLEAARAFAVSVGAAG